LVAAPERLAAALRDAGYEQGDNAWNLNAPVFAMWGTAVRQVREATATDVQQFASFRPASTDMAHARNFRIIPLWWWMLPMVGISRWFGVALAAMMVAVGAWFLCFDYRRYLWCATRLDAPSSVHMEGTAEVVEPFAAIEPKAFHNLVKH
jgi:hypothetical protein